MKNIALFRSALIGDNIVALHGIYAIKYLYTDSVLVVYTNSIGEELFRNFNFIDVLINTDNFTPKLLLDNINSFEFDYFILTQCNREQCNFINKTNAKKIISFLTAGSVFKTKFITTFISRNINKLPQYKRILKLVRLIDPKHYDNNIKNIDFSAIRIKQSDSNKYFVNDFFISNNVNMDLPIVLINPFVYTTSHNLSISGWVQLINELSKMNSNINFVIVTYSANKDISEYISSKNVFIFNNNSRILNLIPLLKQSILLISPSTGISHLANNQNIPILWLCSNIDKNLWKGDNMDSNLFVILKKSSKKLSFIDEQYYIEEIKLKFINFIRDINLINRGF